MCQDFLDFLVSLVYNEVCDDQRAYSVQIHLFNYWDLTLYYGILSILVEIPNPTKFLFGAFEKNVYSAVVKCSIFKSQCCCSKCLQS